MLVHIVLFKVDASSSQADVGRFESRIKALRSLPSVIDLHLGPAQDKLYQGYAARNGGYTHALVVYLPDAEALKEYSVSKEHVDCVNEAIKPVVRPGHILAVDYYTVSTPNGASVGVTMGVLGVGLLAGFFLKRIVEQFA